MAECIILKGGGGADLDVINATAPDVLTGKVIVDKQGEPLTGTMPNRGAVSAGLNAGGGYTIPAGYHNGGGKVTANSLASQTPGNASAPKILRGYTAWVNGQKVTGTTTVQSILSFSTAVYSSTAITFYWKNPAKGPFSGVIIVGKTGSYPTGITDGTRYYKGSGNNSNANGISSVTVSSFYSGTTYYYRAFSYALLNGFEWISENSLTSSSTTTRRGQQTFTTSGVFTVPSNVRFVQVFCVGGGGGGSQGNSIVGGSGGAGGYTKTSLVEVTPNQNINVIIGSGGAPGSQGNGTWFAGGSTAFGNYVIANGGGANYPSGGSGGSGGGGASYSYANKVGGSGGFNGNSGGTSSNSGGNGQGYTTRAFGAEDGVLYAGGGGGGSRGFKREQINGGTGGSGGGGNGGGYRLQTSGSSGAANTGGGGGGAGAYYSSSDRDVKASSSGAGGSGICLVRWGY